MSDKKEVVKNMVELEDGSTENFGSRSHLKSSMDLTTKTITFKTITGKVINWVVADVDALSEFQLKVFMYGLLERVKSSLSGVAKEELAGAIQKGIDTINEGEFVIRSIGSSAEVGLTPIMVAFARAKAQSQEAFTHLADTDKQEVIEEVIALWAAKSPVEKRQVHNIPVVAFHLSQIKIEATPDSGIDL